ncbi:hypothetical protein TA3x_003139 [Tundrisphaera sp. TA3]|uniref:hypothetical protein n=1 Tax=Tundrisphaera sp. TA3 TaxID=3435775 RepID=UPI003EBE117A
MNQPGTHKMTEAVQGQVPPSDANLQAEQGQSGPPHPSQAEVAEQTRLAQQGRADGDEDRDAKLLQAGRIQETNR